MKHRIRKRIIYNLCLAAFVTMLFAFIVLPCFNNTVYAEGETQIIDLDKTNVLDDLKSKKGFSLLDYPFYESEKPEIKVIDFVEYCYDYRAEKRDKYGLYVYVYNPNQQVIVTNSEKNNISLGELYNGSPITEETECVTYRKYDLQFCSMSTEEGTLRLFYKFKIIDHKGADLKTIAQRVNPNCRRYDIVGIELLTEKNPNATDYPVSTSYSFSGYEKGFGPEGADTGVELKRNTLETVSLDLKYTTYRPDYINEHGAGHQNQLSSVYFAVPKKFEVYGGLYKVHCSWNEQKTSSIIVTNRQEVYDDVLAHLGTDGSGAAFRIYDHYSPTTLGYNTPSATWGYNANVNIFGGAGLIPDSPVGYVFKTTKENVRDYDVPSADIKKWLADHTGERYLFADAVDEGRTKGEQEYTFTADEAFDMLSFNATASGWQKFCLKWQNFWSHDKWDIGGDNISVEPIRLIKDSDFNGSPTSNAAALFVDDDDYSDFKNYYDTNKYENNVFLLRFAVTDYYSNLQQVIKSSAVLNVFDEKSTYRASETVFLDFDIIDLTFKKDTTETVIPVVASPVDVVGGVTAPIVEDSDSNKFWDIIKTILVVILILILIGLLSPILPYIFKGIIWVISLPFRLISKLFKRRKSKK